MEREEEAEMAEAVFGEQQWRERVANAAKLHQGGILFAFTTQGTGNLKEFWQNLRRAVQAGLPKEAALKALTINATKLFGVDRPMGTAEAGKVANLVAMTDEFTEEQAQVRYLFIDGRKFEPRRERTPQRSLTPTPSGAEQSPHFPSLEFPLERDGRGDDEETN